MNEFVETAIDDALLHTSQRMRSGRHGQDGKE